MSSFSFGSKRNDGIDARGAARGEPCSEKRDKGNQTTIDTNVIGSHAPTP